MILTVADTGNEVKQKTLDTGNKVKQKSANTGNKVKQKRMNTGGRVKQKSMNTGSRTKQKITNTGKSQGKKLNRNQILKKREKRLKWLRRGLLVMSAVMLAAVIGTMFWKTEIVEFTVTNNHYLTEEIIKDSLFESALERRYFYAWFQNRFGQKKTIPMIEDYTVSFEGTNRAVIEVKEKEPAGYVVYVDTYLAFDDEGYLLSSNVQPTDEIPAIEGIAFEKIVLYQKLAPTNPEVFEEALFLMELLDKYEIDSERIIFDSEDNVSVRTGDILVSLGDENHLEDKIRELESLSEEIQGLKGTLYLDDCTGAQSKKRYIFLPE